MPPRQRYQPGRAPQRRMSPAPSAQKKNELFYHRPRVRFLAFCVVAVAAAVIVRLWFVQVVGGDEYRTRAQDQYMMSADLAPDRGTIYFTDKAGRYPAAINKDYAAIYLVPRLIRDEDRDRIIGVLRDTLGADAVDEGAIRAKMDKRNDPFEMVARRVEEDIAARIRDAKIAGLGTQRETYRYYPAKTVGAQTIGFVGASGEDAWRGRYGIEASLEPVLAGRRGHVRQARDAAGRWIATTDRTKEDPENGADVVLTIDYAVQRQVEEILDAAAKEHEADSASAVVMRPDGRILAMAVWPTFDPNEYRKVEDIGVFINPIVSHTYEPGSVLKTMTEAIGVDTDAITPTTTFTDPGFVSEAGYTIRNAEDKVYGTQTMTQALENSINTGMIFIERLVGHGPFADYMHRFGFGEKTGVRLPGEVAGSIRNLDPPFATISFYTASFGQGVSMTPLQLTRAYAVIANGGMLVTPRIVDRIVRHDGTEESMPLQEEHRVLRAESAAAVREMLESVVVRGHGKRAAVPGYRVGGKTGTAQVARSDGRGYEEDKTVGTFAGLAPIGEAQFVVTVKIDNPKGVKWAETVAAPAFQKIMAFLLRYESIPPTEPLPTPKVTTPSPVTAAPPAKP